MSANVKIYRVLVPLIEAHYVVDSTHDYISCRIPFELSHSVTSEWTKILNRHDTEDINISVSENNRIVALIRIRTNEIDSIPSKVEQLAEWLKQVVADTNSEYEQQDEKCYDVLQNLNKSLSQLKFDD